jgi:myosin heavy subunit
MLSTDEIRALIQRIGGDSELRTEFRRAILSDDEYNLLKLVRELAVQVAALSVTVDDLAKAQKRTEQRIEELAEAQRRTEEQIAELAAAQKRTEERLEELAAAQKRTEERLEELAEAQRRTEERLEELAEAQKRTEERVGRLEIAMAELAEAQKRTEERVGRLEIAMAELAEAQKRTEERVGRLETAMARLAEAQEKTWSKLARLDERIGVTTEQEAADMLGYVLRQKGYEILSGPFNLPLNGEIDVIYTVQDAEGKRLTVVLEAKTRLGYSAVERWAQAMRSGGLQQRLSERGYEGPYLVYVYGMRADPSSYEAAKKYGIGLITDRGEQIEPAGELPAS